MKKLLTRFLSIVVVIAMVTSLFVMPAFAATSCTKTVRGQSQATFYLTSGKGVSYSLRLKKTTVSIKNNSKRDLIVEQRNDYGILVGSALLNPGRSDSFTMTGSAKTGRLICHFGSGVVPSITGTVTVTMSAGSVS